MGNQGSSQPPPDDIRERALSFLKLRQAILKERNAPLAVPPSDEDEAKKGKRSASIHEFREREDKKD